MVQSKDSGGFPSALFVPLHSVCSKRLCVVQSAQDEDEQGDGHPDTSQKQNIRGTGPRTTGRGIELGRFNLSLGHVERGSQELSRLHVQHQLLHLPVGGSTTRGYETLQRRH
ncbi:hypothetical protein EYF80_026081 [Liparis tanakae]|uniref:Uncharacterized protein n=1 Tax=Liparis tanakae TaxID=230148 RepID=A0A4Z2HFA4_9TELE|nr:hypothetical protein EYF80_026081 [Liparis tanakae]